MNRRDRLRLDERRRGSYGSNRDFEQKSDHGAANFSGHQLDSYFQSQQVILSLLERSGADETDQPRTGELSKSFRIPRKQSQPAGRDNTRDRSRSNELLFERRDDIFSNRSGYESRKFGPSRNISNDRPPNKQFDRRNERNNQRDDIFRNRNSNESRRTQAGPASRNDPTRKERVFVAHERRRRRGTAEVSGAVHNSRGMSYRKVKPREKKIFDETKPSQVFIFDRTDPSGKILSKNVPALIAGLATVVKTNVLSTVDISPKFLGHCFEGGVLVILCADSFSSEFLHKEVPLMPPPWSNADLDCTYESYGECLVTLILPQLIVHLSEFLVLCKAGDKRLDTVKWRRLPNEDGGERILLGIDLESYQIIRANNGIIRCGDADVKVSMKYVREKKVKGGR